jgi:hypothetical protein
MHRSARGNHVRRRAEMSPGRLGTFYSEPAPVVNTTLAGYLRFAQGLPEYRSSNMPRACSARSA